LCGKEFEAQVASAAKGRHKHCSIECGYQARAGRGRKADPKFFWDKVRKTKFCWIWQGGRTGSNYGELHRNNRPILAHRYSYELHYGPITNGLWVLHHCDNPPCVNPSHLFLGTPKDNTQDMINKGRAAFMRKHHKPTTRTKP
jgi:hypothetical protein